MELLRQRNVRLIAVNENVDTFREEDDFTPFRNIMNEWYARDTSKKIKSTFKAKGNSGKHVANTPPYGYLKDPQDKNHWIIDEEAAEIVRRIFRMTMEEKGPYQIAEELKLNMEFGKYVHKKRGMNMKRELVECYYEAHMKEIQEAVKNQQIKEMDEEISLLD